MTPAQRVALDRRISDERMTELQPHGEPPEGIAWGEGLYVFAMDAAGVLHPRKPIDEIDWRDVVAIKTETSFGVPTNADELIEEDVEWGGFGSGRE